MASTEADSFQIGAFTVAKNASARELADKLNRLREAVDQCRLQPGVGYTLNRGPGGTTLSIHAGGGGGAVLPDPYPFRVELRSDSSGLYFYVEPQSYLDGELLQNAGSLIPLGVKTITEVWLCVLQLPVNGFQPGVARLQAYKESDFPGAVVPANGRQTQANLILASLSPNLQLVQNVRKNLTTLLANNGGFPAFLPSEL